MTQTDLTTYPSEITERVKTTLRKQLRQASEAKLDDQIKAMTKSELMDKFVDSFDGNITSFEIIRFVKSIFHFDLETTPVLSSYLKETGNTTIQTSYRLIDSHLAHFGSHITGAEIRRMMNQVFGVNLDAINALEGSRISLYSKGLWVVRQTQDLFVVYTGAGDVDVKVYPTAYFIEQTGLTDLPVELQQSLASFGFYFDEKVESFYYSTLDGKAVSDDFKGRTIGAILQVIKKSYAHL